jgi:formate hydrogenlyase subunit 3/multisubunit Na+/H+ antiporter MnhD subunit
MDVFLFNGSWPLLSVLIFLPLAGACLLPLMRGARVAKIWVLGVTLVNAALSLKLYTGFDLSTAQYQFAETARWIPSLNICYTLGVDGISLLLVIMTTLLMPLCVLCSWNAIEKRVKEFLACILVMETSMLGVFLSLDFVLFYIFWEAMLIPMFLLIGVWGGPRKIYASVKFFPLHAGRVGAVAGGHHRALPAQRAAHLLDSGPDGSAARRLAPEVAVPGIFHRVRHQGSDVPVPHVASGGPRGSPDGG